MLGWIAPTPPRCLDPQIAQNHTRGMDSVILDTLKFTKHHEGAGLPPQQAVAISDVLAEATGAELVTKDHLKVQITAAKHDLIKRMAGLLVAQTGLVVAAIRLLQAYQ